MMTFGRQTDLIKCDMHTPIMVVGAGGIGSFTTLTLAKMGFDRLSVYDFDTVEVHNLPNQFYRLDDIGRPKVEALQDIVLQFTGTNISTYNQRFNAEDVELFRPKVLVSAVDSMSVRKELYDAFEDCRLDLFLDGRMGADQAEVYCVKYANAEMDALYRSRLWSDMDTAPVPCTSKATMYNCLTIASLIANTIRLALMREPVHFGVIVDNKNIGMHYVKGGAV